MNNLFPEEPQPDSFNAEFGLGLDKGQQRDNNEDSLGITAFQKEGTVVEVYVLADGMGGHEAGETASQTVVQSVIQTLTDYIENSPLPQQYGEWLNDAVNTANQAIYQQAQQQKTKVGSTLVVAILVNNDVYVASVGDSRAYVITPHGLRQVTHDQSFVQALLDSGAISPAQAETHPYRNILTHSIGQDNKVQVELFSEHLQAHELLMLCSDGLWKMLEPDTILKIISDTSTLKSACQGLIDAANTHGGEDNISVVLIRPKL